MRKQFLLMLILCLTASLAWAERIDVATARKVAESVAQREGAASGLRSASELPLVYAAAPGQSGSALRSGAMEGAADYFVFNFPGGKGFAIVAGDDRVRPVLGYSGEGSFDPDNLPENLRGWLAGYQEQITWAVNKGIEATPEISAEWSQLMSGTALRAAGGEVLQTAKWNQEEPYNNQTPVINGKKTYTGCGATAAAIIMRYNMHPDVVTKGVSYYNVRGVDYPVSYAPYQWDKMPLNYNPGNYTAEEANQVAALMWHIGANVKMNYDVIGTEGSSSNGTDIAAALRSVFEYSPALRYVYKTDYRWEDWKMMIRNEINQNRPILYRGAGSGGHLFVLDGYNQQEAFHFNWGWGGSADGFYLLTSLDPNGNDFSQGMGMIMGIKPAEAGDKPVYALTYLSLSSSLASLVGQTSFSVSARFKNTGGDTFKGYANIGVINGDGRIMPISTSRSIDLPLGNSYKYAFSYACTLSAPLSASDKILPIYSLDDTNWTVMAGAADAPLYINQNGVVQEGDDPNNPTEQPLRVNVYYNGIAQNYLAVSGLDNNGYAGDNVTSVNYRVENAREDFVLCYTLKDYAVWKDHVRVYLKKDTEEDFYLPGSGTLVDIENDGSFKVPLALSQLNSGGEFIHEMKVLSDKAGSLPFEITVYEKSDLANPVYEDKSCVMRFVGSASAKIEPNPIIGTVNKRIPISYTISDVDPSLVGQDLSFYVSIKKLSIDQVKLFYKNGSSEQEIELKSSNDNLYAHISMGKLSEGVRFEFILEPKAETSEAYFYISPNLNNGASFPCSSSGVLLRIQSVPVTVHSIKYVLEHLSVPNHMPTAIENGKELWVSMEKENGYDYPSEVSVIMAGKTLKPGSPDNGDYQYVQESGYIYIPAVTGDVVITAAAEPIPAVTYMIKASELIGATSDIPEGGLSVKENSGCTIKLTAKPGYLIKKADVIIKTTDKTLQEGKDYTYTEAADYKSGTVKMHAVTADMELFVYADPEPKSFTVTGKLTNLTANKDIVNGMSVKENESFDFILTPATDYRLPEDITVTPSTIEYTYDKTSGKVVIKKVTENVTITAAAIDDHHFNVILKPGEGVVATPNAIEQLFTVGEKAAFNVRFAAAEGYTYDGLITVVMGEKTLAIGTDYTYNKETGEFKLLKGIEAALIISTAKGTQKSYSVTTNYKNVSTPAEELPKNVLHGEALSFKIMPDEGYNLPEAIEVKMGGKPITAKDYTYNKATGEVSIAKVTGNVEVIASAVVKTYEVKLNLTQLNSGFVPGTKVTHGEPLEITLTAFPGYELPKEVTVLMNGKPDTNFRYKDGKISIAKVLGPIEITAKANKLHSVKENGENVTITGSENVAEGETFTATVSAGSDYYLPYAISVLMGNRQLRADEYTYDRESGKIEVKNVTGPLSITVKGVKKGYFEVVLNLANLTSDPASFEPQAEDTKIELTLKPSSGYELPSGVTVKMGDTPLAAGTDYTYDRSTGKFTLEKITSTLVITANGSRIPEPEPEPEPTPTTYTVTLPVVEGAVISASGSTTVTEGSSFSFTVEVKAGYNATNMVVKANGSTLTADANGRYTVANIRSNVVVTVTGIVKGDNPTANETIGSDELRVWAANGRLFIQTPEAERAYIVTFDGRVYKTLSLPAGEYSERMPQGSYIIHIGGESYKIQI